MGELGLGWGELAGAVRPWTIAKRLDECNGRDGNGEHE
jgi:hypothetical protein